MKDVLKADIRDSTELDFPELIKRFAKRQSAV
jgi:hypothetical protein